jgi:hypothetical protein
MIVVSGLRVVRRRKLFALKLAQKYESEQFISISSFENNQKTINSLSRTPGKKRKRIEAMRNPSE